MSTNAQVETQIEGLKKIIETLIDTNTALLQLHRRPEFNAGNRIESVLRRLKSQLRRI